MNIVLLLEFNLLKDLSISKTGNIFKSDVDHYDVLFEDSYDPMTVLKGQYFIDVNKAELKLLKMSSKNEFYKLHPSQISLEYQADGRRSDEKSNEMIGKCYENGIMEFLIDTIKDKKLENLVVLEVVESEGMEIFKEVTEFIAKV